MVALKHLPLFATTSAPPSPDLTFTLAPVISAPYIPGIQRVLGATRPTWAIEVYERGDTLTSVARFTSDDAIGTSDVLEIEGLRQLTDPGAGHLTLPNDQAILDDLIEDRLIRVLEDDRAIWQALIGPQDSVLVDQGEEANENTVVPLVDSIAILTEDRLNPPVGTDSIPKVDDRRFDYTSSFFDDTAWVAATEIADQGSGTYWGGLPPGWSYGGKWIGASLDSEEWAPQGFRVFRREITVPAGVTKVMVSFSVDDVGECYWDEQPIASTDNQANEPTQIRQRTFDVSPGVHIIAGYGTNSPDDPALPPFTHNPFGILWAVNPKDAQGNVFAALAVSDASTKMFEYPAELPGMTFGQILDLTITDSQTRGYMTDLAWSFTALVDTNGQPWPVLQGVTEKVGTDLLQMARRLAATYGELRMRYGELTLDAFVPGGAAVNSGVVLAKGVNIASLSQKQAPRVADDFLVAWTQSWHQHVGSGSPSIRKRGLLSLTASSTAEVDMVAAGQIADFGRTRGQVSVQQAIHDLTPAAERPSRRLPGQLVTVPVGRALTPTLLRELSSSFRLTDRMRPFEWTMTVGDRIYSPDQRIAAAVKQMTDGTVGGHSVPATPLSSLTTPGPNCCAPPVT